MSNLSKITIQEINDKTLHLKIERIHPDAPTLDWLEEQNDTKIKEVVLFRIMNLLEGIQRDKKKIFKLYSLIHKLLVPEIEEEYDKKIELNKYTKLTEYGSEILENIVNNVICSVRIIEEDLNDNWENNSIQNFNPYKSEKFNVPFIKCEIVFQEDVLEKEYENKSDYSALSISCVD